MSVIEMNGRFTIVVKGINVSLTGDALVDYEDGDRTSGTISEALKGEVTNIGDGDLKVGLLKFLSVYHAEFDIEEGEIVAESYDNQGFDS